LISCICHNIDEVVRDAFVLLDATTLRGWCLSEPQRVTSYPQSNLLALSEKLAERQLRLTGGEHLMVTKLFRTSELQQMNLLTIQEVANWAKVSTKTIYRWNSDNKIPGIRLGNRTYRIPEQAIINYLKQNGFDHLLP
jgi:excisionase family DNA binding protein